MESSDTSQKIFGKTLVISSDPFLSGEYQNLEQFSNRLENGMYNNAPSKSGFVASPEPYVR
jgi:hypothetical protein